MALGLTIQNGYAQGGPPGGRVRALAIDPSTPATLYAGTVGAGVFKSIDRGATWAAANSGITTIVVSALAIDPVSSTTVYAGGTGIFKSTNGGTSWSAVNSGLPLNTFVSALAIDPSTSSTVYAGTGTGVFKSTNGGTSWTAVNSGLPNNTVRALAIDPSTPATLYAGTDTCCGSSDVFKSTDGGASWTSAGTGPRDVNALAIHPADPSTLYAGTFNGVFKSTSGGTTWTAVNSGLPDPNTTTYGLLTYALAINPADPSTLYAATFNGVFKSSNGGAVWIAVNSGLPDPNTYVYALEVYALAIDPSTPATVYAGNDGAGVFKSVNGAATWAAANSGLGNTNVSAMAIDPSASATLYAGASSGGVFKSTNGGASWIAVNSGLTTNTFVNALAIDPSTPTTVYAGTQSGGVFKSTDGGTSWTAVNSGLTRPPGSTPAIYAVYSLAIDHTTPSTLYAAGAGVFKSTDGGSSWTAASSGITSWVHALAIDPSNIAILYAGTDGGGVFKSTNGGTSWTAANTGTFPNFPFGLQSTYISALAIDPSAPSTLYAGAPDPYSQGHTRGVFKTTNGGTIWTRVSSDLTNAQIWGLAIDPSTPSTLYAGTNAGGAFKSINGGTSWTAANSGLTTTNVQAVVIDLSTPFTLYAGTNGAGIFKSIDGGAHWQPTGAAFDNSVPLAAATPYRPAGGGTSTSPTFQWSAVTGATSYRLMVATSAGALPTAAAAATCSACAINTTTATNYYIPPAPLSAATTYYWQVQGRSATQNGAWSTPVSFTTAATGGLTITAVSPSPVVSSNAAQTLTIFGTGFQSGMTATLVNVTNGGAPSVKATSSLTSTKASISATFATAAANWTVMVTNPGGSTSGVFPFRVVSPAAVGSDLRASRITIDTIASPQTAGSAFAVTVRTVDANGNLLVIGTDIQLRTSVGTVNPSSIHLTNGTGSAQVKLDSASCGVHLEATGAGANGTSNTFAVQGTGQGTLTGRVTNPAGTTLQGAVVTLTGCGGGSIPVTAGTSGKYTTPQLASGAYTVIATFGGVSSNPVNVNIATGSCTFLNDIVIEASPCNPNGLTPILFVPGIMGSTTTFSILPSYPSLPADSPTQQSDPPYTPDSRWAPGPAPHLEGLYYSRLFKATEWDILGEQIRQRNAAYGTNTSGVGFVPNPCLVVPVPYDWRMSPDDAALKYLIPRIKSAKAAAGVSKVHIVAHSMGGLVARSYIESAIRGVTYAGDVDKLAMVGTPNEGAELAYLLAEGGNPLRADMVAVANGSTALYRHVVEDQYGKYGGSLDALTPAPCRPDYPLTGLCAPLQQLPEDPAWNDYRRAMKTFVKSMPSILALMPNTRPFLNEGNGQPPRAVAASDYQNQFLNVLNDPAKSGIFGAPQAMTFAGIQKNTVDIFTVTAPRSADALSPDGEYRGFAPTGDGDGTVRRASVLASTEFTVPTLDNTAGTHTQLIRVYSSAIANFLFGLPQSNARENEEQQSDLRSSGVAATASASAPNFELRVTGRARPYLLNGSGQGCGLKPGTSDLDQTLPGCSSIVAQPLESVLSLAGIPNGVYTLTLTSSWAEDSAISATVDDGSNTSDIHTTLFCEVESRNVTVTIAAGTTTPIRIDGASAPASALLANAVGTPRMTALNWTASTDAVGYNVYSKRIDEPKLALLAQVTGNSYTSTDPWADAAGVPVRNYAVAARVASGQTSVLTAFAANNDRDHDKLSDLDETRYGTDPDNPDTDGDGLFDGDEVAMGTDPLNADTDGDGFPDGLEVSRGSDPSSPGSTPVALQPPGNVVATATSTSQVQVSWSAVAGAVSYEVYRSSNHGPYGLAGTPTVNGFTDSGLTAATTYVYVAKAIDSTAGASPASNADLATTIMFTDDPLVAGSTFIKAAHLNELRTAVNAVRTAAGLPPSVLSDAAQGLPIRAAHVNELRSSLDAARTALGLSPLAYPDPVLGVGTTRVRAVHLSSLRDGVK